MLKRKKVVSPALISRKFRFLNLLVLSYSINIQLQMMTTRTQLAGFISAPSRADIWGWSRHCCIDFVYLFIFSQ